MGAIPAQVLTNLHELTQHSALRMTRVVAYCTPANKRSTSENKGAKLWLSHISKQRSSIVGFSCRHLCVAAIGAGAETCNHDAMSWSRLVRIASCVSDLVHISKQRS